MMKLLKIVLITIGIYAGLVVIFESLLGYFQPQSQTTLMIITDDGEGRENNRVLQQLSSEGNIYVAANHWPRAWYHDVLDRPNVKATINDETANYLVTKVSKTRAQGTCDRIRAFYLVQNIDRVSSPRVCETDAKITRLQRRYW